MAKVVLVWNEHPTEVVAGFHARKVAKILREQYGHDVKISKIPVKTTSYGILHDQDTPLQDRLTHLVSHFTSEELTNYFAKKTGMLIFNFHSTEAARMAEATIRKPHDFRISARDSGKPKGELEVLNIGKNAFIVETPAHFRLLPGKVRRRTNVPLIRVGASEIAKRLRTKKEKIRFVNKFDDIYQEKVSPLGSTRQQKYLHPAISEKIAQAIHERITRK
ncbi:MAG: hypothetical protein Q8R15_01495 [Candidatus Micrarchaeota archaeon]|nr:hypothetical protein [Candidatus Micrarchaeota archaeon]